MIFDVSVQDLPSFAGVIAEKSEGNGLGKALLSR